MPSSKFARDSTSGRRSSYLAANRAKRSSVVAARRIQSAARARIYRSRIKRVMLSQCETKTSSQRFWAGTNAAPLYHNVTNYGMLNLLATTQGTDNPAGTTEDGRNRIGTEIILRGLSLKFMFITAQSRPNLNIMGYVFSYEAALSAITDGQFWCGPSGQGASQNRFLDRPNLNKVKILKKFYVHNLPNYSTVVPGGQERSNTLIKSLYIPMKNRKLKYQIDGTGAGTNVPKFRDIGVALVAFDTTNSLTSDIVGYATAQTTLYFKDP